MGLFERLRATYHKISNARLYRRIPSDITVKVYEEGSEEAKSFRMTNWSPGGVFLSSENLIPLHMPVIIEFQLKGSGLSHVRLRGQVVRHQDQPNFEKGFGVMFTDFSESGLEILREFLSKESIFTTEP